MNGTKSHDAKENATRRNVLVERTPSNQNCRTITSTASVLFSLRRTSDEIIHSPPELVTNASCEPYRCSTVEHSMSEGSVFFSRRRKSDDLGVVCEPKLKVIVDVDAGIDDALALVLLVAADNEKAIKILGITCTHGNTSVNNVCVNVLRLLGSMGRFDIPVYKGVEEALITRETKCEVELEHFHGLDGFGDLTFAYTPSTKLVQPENAVTAMNRITSDPSLAGKVTLLCLAPLTNIALAMKTYSQFSGNIKNIFVMGGNSTGMGNITSSGEFNFYSDPEAAHIVLTSSRCPVYLLPWETCLQTNISFDWRYNVLGAIQNPYMDLLNAVEKKVWEKSRFKTWFPCDSFLAAAALEPEIIVKMRKCHACVELHGTHTRGQVVLDHLKIKAPNVNLIESVDVSLMKKMLLWAAGHSDSGYNCKK